MSRKRRQNPVIPILFLLLIFGQSAVRFSIQTVNEIVRAVTTGVSIGLDKFFDRSSAFGGIALGVIIGLVFYYRRFRKKSREQDPEEDPEEDGDETENTPFCPPIMDMTESGTTDDEYVPPMYHRSGS